MRILVVEDNRSLLESIKSILSNEFEVDGAENGEDGLFLALQNIYDLIVLDVMLPEMEGFEVIQHIREADIRTPVLFLTAKDSLEDRVKGLDFGGDDYLVKPFQAPELQARIRALLRRSGSLTRSQTIRYKGIELFGKEKEVMIDETPVRLTFKQYEMLEYIIQNKGAILTKEQLYDRVWALTLIQQLLLLKCLFIILERKWNLLDTIRTYKLYVALVTC